MYKIYGIPTPIDASGAAFRAAYLTAMAEGDWRGDYGNAPCPICQPESRRDQRALSIGFSQHLVLVYCHKSQCRFEDIMLALDLPRVDNHRTRTLPNPQPRTFLNRPKHNLSRARALWKRARTIAGTIAELYLRNRGINCDLPPGLRFLDNEYCLQTGRYHPVMVARVEPTEGVHRTFLYQSSTCSIAAAKLMLGPCAGGAVVCAEGTGPLVVCEGIETGLSLASGLIEGTPRILAALSTSGMRKLELPDQAGHLIVATDGDVPGYEAGEQLAHRARKAGWRVAMLPAPDGQDWNDILYNIGGKL